MANVNRRDFLQLVGVGGGVVFASGLLGGTATAGARHGARMEDFFFLQLSDSHWGFHGPPNPEADVTLGKAVATINGMIQQPDFIVFTGDLTHTTDDPTERRARMAGFKKIIGGLNRKEVKFLPGEHDASLDKGAAYKEFFGPLHHSFSHKGIHFVALDNVSDPGASLGDAQLDWLRADLRKLGADVPVVVLAHRPLFDLAPQWDWATRDGSKAIDILQHHKNVTVFYGHIHQENHHQTGDIAHHAARSLIFPLPAPGSVPKKAPIPWDPAHPGQGLGYRQIESDEGGRLHLTEFPVSAPATRAGL